MQGEEFYFSHVLIAIPTDTQVGIVRGSWIDEIGVQE